MKKRLLLADDSVTIQKVVQITFSHDDYELTVVDNGDIAYEKARSQRPDLILADVFMPGKNGYELCAAVKNDPSLATVPVLLLTGTFEPFDEAKAKSVGADRWIAKPFESQALIACVEELLKRAAQAPVIAPPVLIPTPLFAPVPVEAVGFAQPDFSADLSDDIWGSDFPAVSTVDSSDRLAADVFAPSSQDDLWDVSGFESEGQAADADDLWGGSFEPTAIPSAGETAAPVTATGGAGGDLWEADDFSTSFELPTADPVASGFSSAGTEEIPLADDVEILEEIDLLEPIADVPSEISSAAPFVAGDFSFDEELVQPEVVAASHVVAAAAPAPLLIPAPRLAAPRLVMDVAPRAVEIPLATGASTNAATLSADQLELIVERVAGVVISRLAGTLLEKIAWEVVPDLAETMIKEELRKIREAVVAG